MFRLLLWVAAAAAAAAAAGWLRAPRQRHSLRGRHVVVTGGSEGIGLAVAQAVLRRGGRVSLLSRSREKLRAAAAACEKIPNPGGAGGAGGADSGAGGVGGAGGAAASVAAKATAAAASAAPAAPGAASAPGTAAAAAVARSGDAAENRNGSVQETRATTGEDASFEAGAASAAGAAGAGSRVATHALDVSDGAAVATFFASLAAPPDAVVCCAGLCVCDALTNLTDGDIASMLDVNLKGTLFVAREFMRCIEERRGAVGPGASGATAAAGAKAAGANAAGAKAAGAAGAASAAAGAAGALSGAAAPAAAADARGSAGGEASGSAGGLAGERQLVLVSSIAGQLGIFGFSGYSATKFGLRGLWESLTQEAAGRGLRVICAFPPNTDTPGFATENARKPAETRWVEDQGGLYTAAAVAEAVVCAIERPGRTAVTFGAAGAAVAAAAAGFGPPAAGAAAGAAEALLATPLRIVAVFLHLYWKRKLAGFAKTAATPAS